MMHRLIVTAAIWIEINFCILLGLISGFKEKIIMKVNKIKENNVPRPLLAYSTS
jgi:hypothetical protein